MLDTTPPGAQPRRPETFSIKANSPAGELIDHSDLSEEDVEQISRLMQALGNLRNVERQLSEGSAKYMALNETDMRALHFLIVCENSSEVVTPSRITQHLGISPATTTKLLDRLEKAGHITRSPHASDRRATEIRITAETRRSAYETVGAQQARRFHAAARLTSEEREVVISFLHDMAEEIDMKHADWAQK